VGKYLEAYRRESVDGWPHPDDWQSRNEDDAANIPDNEHKEIQKNAQNTTLIDSNHQSEKHTIPRSREIRSECMKYFDADIRITIKVMAKPDRLTNIIKMFSWTGSPDSELQHVYTLRCKQHQLDTVGPGQNQCPGFISTNHTMTPATRYRVEPIITTQINPAQPTGLRNFTNYMHRTDYQPASENYETDNNLIIIVLHRPDKEVPVQPGLCTPADIRTAEEHNALVAGNRHQHDEHEDHPGVLPGVRGAGHNHVHHGHQPTHSTDN
jgi:hypothetical protein